MMSSLNSLFSNIPEEEAPAAPLRRIYPLEKGNGNTQQCSWSFERAILLSDQSRKLS